MNQHHHYQRKGVRKEKKGKKTRNRKRPQVDNTATQAVFGVVIIQNLNFGGNPLNRKGQSVVSWKGKEKRCTNLFSIEPFFLSDNTKLFLKISMKDKGGLGHDF